LAQAWSGDRGARGGGLRSWRGASLVAFALGAAVAPLSGEETPGNRCRLEIVAYEDGSASLYCAGEPHRFAVVDAESGRIEISEP
jgi:hypothetical protein